MRRPTAGQTATMVLALGFLAGIILRIFMLGFIGTDDMKEYYRWGREALESGLFGTYHGIYFPLQYQIFEFCAWIVSRSGFDFVPIFKLSNLVFDVGSFWLMCLLLQRQGSNPAYALLYWLHPWFLSVFALGYIDFHFTFFALLSVYLLGRETFGRYILAGLPLACAFLMKPQAQILLIASFLFGVFHYRRTKNARPLGMLVFPILIFLAYEASFTIALFAEQGYRAAFQLPRSYLQITNVMPALTAQMTNIWYPVAYALKGPTDPIYAISDQIEVLPGISLKYLAAATVLGLIGTHVFRAARTGEPSVGDRFARIFGFAGIAVPFIMTSAHENHLFLGSVFLVLLGARLPLPFNVAGHILLMVQFLNIYGLYGEHPRRIGRALREHYHAHQMLPLVYSLISVACVAVILAYLWNVRHAAFLSGRPSPTGRS